MQLKKSDGLNLSVRSFIAAIVIIFLLHKTTNRFGAVRYRDWFRWSSKFQLLNLILTSLILIFGLMIGY